MHRIPRKRSNLCIVEEFLALKAKPIGDIIIFKAQPPIILTVTRAWSFLYSGLRKDENKTLNAKTVFNDLDF